MPTRRDIRHDPRAWLAVFLGGAIGGLARGALDHWHPAGSGWPWVTFAVNLVGAALLALVAARPPHHGRPAGYVRPFLGTGVCASLTTFATLQVEVVRLADAGRSALAAGYLVASIAGGLVVAFAVLHALRPTRWGR